MDGLMMDYQLNVPALLRRADELYGENEIASRLPDKSWHRYTYADFVSRTKKLVVGLSKLGLEDGDRVGTFMWNHSQHLETYMGSPVGGFVTHTLNLRLHPDDNTYIATHGGDRVIIVDKVLWPLAEQFVGRCSFEHVIAVGDGPTPDGAIDYEDLIADADESAFSYRDIPENAAAAMCYTSGTTGRPKGVLYSHRAIAIHALTVIGCLGMHADDVCLPVVPMFHANAWCFPYSCTMTGVKQVFPGPHLDPVSLLEDFQQEKVTVTAGVPTIWMGILQTLDANPGAYDLSSIRYMTVGGAAPPRAMIEAFSERHGLHVTHGWGMTEMSPVGTISGAPGQETGLSPQDAYTRRAMQGAPIPFVEIRASGEDGFVPLGRRDDGRARGARTVDRIRLLRVGRGRGSLDERRLVQDGRRRDHSPRRVRRGAGSREGPREVGRRVDLHGRAREHAHGTSGRRGGRRHRGAGRKVVGAAARSRRAARGRGGDARRAPRVPRAELCEVVAPRPVRVRRRDPEDRGRQVPQDGAS